MKDAAGQQAASRPLPLPAQAPMWKAVMPQELAQRHWLQVASCQWQSLAPQLLAARQLAALRPVPMQAAPPVLALHCHCSQLKLRAQRWRRRRRCCLLPRHRLLPLHLLMRHQQLRQAVSSARVA